MQESIGKYWNLIFVQKVTIHFNCIFPVIQWLAKVICTFHRIFIIMKFGELFSFLKKTLEVIFCVIHKYIFDGLFL